MKNEDIDMIDYSGTDNLEVMADAVNYNQFLIELIKKYAKRGDRVLDFGAGIGTFANSVAERGYSISCVEPDPKQASIIRKSGLEVYADLTQMDDNSVDYVYSLNVLEHIEDDRAILQDIYRKLTPGGRLLIYVPAFPVLYSSMDQKVGHYRRYTRSSLAAVVNDANFTVLKTRYADSIGFLATILYKISGNTSGGINLRALTIYDRLIFPLSRILDGLLGLFIGKNVVLIAAKQEVGRGES